MNQNMTQQNIGTQSTKLSEIINSMMRAMKTDYPINYKSACKNQEGAVYLKKRLMEKLKIFNHIDIIDGYEIATEQSPDFMPTIPAIYSQVSLLHDKRKQKEKNAQETLRMENSPEPTIKCNPLAMLAEAKAKLKIKYPNDTEEARIKRLAIAREEHKKVMEAYEKKKANTGVSQEHMCGFHSCYNAGTMSHGLKGDSTFYCNAHFRRAG